VIPRSRIQSFALFAMFLAIAGCGKKTEQAAVETTPPATESDPNVNLPMTFSWNAQSNCLQYVPSTARVRSGATENFNTATSDTVWITAPAGCFSAAETTFAVVRGSNGPYPVARTPGTYNLTIRPGVCTETTGGPGPSVIVDSGVGEGGQ